MGWVKRIDELRLQFLKLWAAPVFESEKIAVVALELKKLASLGQRGDPTLMPDLQIMEGWKPEVRSGPGQRKMRKI